MSGGGLEHVSRFPASVEVGLQFCKSWRYITLGGSGFCLVGLELFGLELSLGWRKAVSRMAASRGRAVNHRLLCLEGVVPSPSGEA